ncbi:MAG: hypothetical protein KC502_02595 [Myxococcales bacterium]|nr:hypothetical protein [Myxococcales bacterium]
MSQPFKLRYQNEIVGVFALGAVLTVFIIIALMGRSRQWFETTFPCDIRFSSGTVALIGDGMDVRIGSQVIGRVTGSSYDKNGRVIAHAAVTTRHRKAVRADSIAVLYTPIAGLPGEPFIELKGGKSTQSIAVGGTLQGRAAEDLLQLATDVLTDSRQTLRPTLIQVEKLTRRLNTILDTVAPEKDLPKLTKRITALLDQTANVMARADKLIGRADGLIGKMDQGDGLVARAVNDPKLVRQVVDLIVRVQSAAVSMERTLATADRVIRTSNGLADKTSKVLGQAGRALQHLPVLMKSGKRALGDLVKITASLRKIAPKVPGLMSQIDDVLLETRAVMDAAERHWLLSGTLRPTATPAPLPSSGLRDAPPAPTDAQLNKLLGAP